MSDGYIGVDFDGTLAHYDEWKGVGVLGEPIPIMVERVKAWLNKGIEVKIFTARMSGDEAALEEIAIKRWCQEHLGQELEVTCIKDYRMEEFWDDRAIRIQKNTGLVSDGSDVQEVFGEPGDIGAVL